jgi:hypothetical protein
MTCPGLQPPQGQSCPISTHAHSLPNASERRSFLPCSLALLPFAFAFQITMVPRHASPLISSMANKSSAQLAPAQQVNRVPLLVLAVPVLLSWALEAPFARCLSTAPVAARKQGRGGGRGVAPALKGYSDVAAPRQADQKVSQEALGEILHAVRVLTSLPHPQESCPLCISELDETDMNFYPCPCG